MKRLMWTYPFLFAILGPMALLSHNIEGEPPYLAVRTILASLGIAGGFMFLLRVVRLDLAEASFSTSLICMTSSVYGNLLQLFGAPATGSGAVGIHLASLVGLIALLAGFLWLIRHAKALSPRIHVFLAVVAGLSVSAHVVRIAAYENVTAQPLTLPSMTAELDTHRPTGPARETPDIYYIILDGYGRDDVIQEIYGLDNAEFYQELAESGFYIAEAASSNYSQTSLSLTSSLNMSYLAELGPLAGTDTSQSQATRLFRHNEVMRVLRSYGYSIIGIPVPYNRTVLPTADRTFDYRPRAMNSFESLSLETSALWSVFVLTRSVDQDLTFPGYAGRRESIISNYEALLAAIDLPGPKFVFAHLAVPHPPFVFDRDGGPADSPYPYREQDGDQFLGGPQDYVSRYPDQLLFANRLASGFLSRLADEGHASDIVILQGDHGPGSGLNWLDVAQTNLRERHAILNAIRIPGIESGTLRPNLSPVNTFRIVFNHLFAASYPILTDLSYFSSWAAPYNFVPISPNVLSRH
jgi:hypothetical protein